MLICVLAQLFIQRRCILINSGRLWLQAFEKRGSIGCIDAIDIAKKGVVSFAMIDNEYRADMKT